MTRGVSNEVLEDLRSRYRISVSQSDSTQGSLNNDYPFMVSLKRYSTPSDFQKDTLSVTQVEVKGKGDQRKSLAGEEDVNLVCRVHPYWNENQGLYPHTDSGPVSLGV